VENVVICRLYDRALVFGAPPQFVHVAVGNCSNSRLFNILASDWKEIEQALVSGSRLISFLPEKIEIFA
jgi:predicted nuclease of predicted toxin-antitoxin system